MNEMAATGSAAHRETTSRWPVFVFWIALQIVALLVARFDVQLTANPAHTAGQWSGEILLMVQIGVSALLFWDMAGTIRAGALAFALAFPLTQIASAGEGWNGLRCSAILLLWLVGLAGWRTAVPRFRGIIAIACLWTWGSAVLWYLVAEFAIGSAWAPALFSVSPLLQAAHPAIPLFAIHAALGLLALGVSLVVSARIGRGK